MTTRIMDLQQAIDRIDNDLIALLQQRFAHAREIGAIKRQAGLPPIDEARVAGQRASFIAHCIASGLDPEMSRQLVLVITEQVIAERLAAAR